MSFTGNHQPAIVSYSHIEMSIPNRDGNCRLPEPASPPSEADIEAMDSYGYLWKLLNSFDMDCNIGLYGIWVNCYNSLT